MQECFMLRWNMKFKDTFKYCVQPTTRVYSLPNVYSFVQ